MTKRSKRLVRLFQLATRAIVIWSPSSLLFYRNQMKTMLHLLDIFANTLSKILTFITNKYTIVNITKSTRCKQPQLNSLLIISPFSERQIQPVNGARARFFQQCRQCRQLRQFLLPLAPWSLVLPSTGFTITSPIQWRQSMSIAISQRCQSPLPLVIMMWNRLFDGNPFAIKAMIRYDSFAHI